MTKNELIEELLRQIKKEVYTKLMQDFAEEYNDAINKLHEVDADSEDWKFYMEQQHGWFNAMVSTKAVAHVYDGIFVDYKELIKEF